MKKIRILFVDFSKDFYQNNSFWHILSKHYEVELDDKNPDYVFYSVFGYEHAKYPNAIKIFYTGENISPNFEYCDYAIGFDYLTLNDRYFRMPLYQLFQYKKDFDAIKNYEFSMKKEKTGFCSFVVSNDNAMKERKDMFDLLNSYKTVSSGGRYLNNVGGPVKNKLEFQSNYKFCLCFENTVGNGYVTEKIIQAFLSGSIPIYYGDPSVNKEFNTDAFVNCSDYQTLNEALEKVKEIDNNPELYENMISSRKFVGKDLETDLENFLLHIFDQPFEKAHRVPNNLHRKLVIKKERVFASYYNLIYLPSQRFRSLIRRLKNKSL